MRKPRSHKGEGASGLRGLRVGRVLLGFVKRFARIGRAAAVTTGTATPAAGQRTLEVDLHRRRDGDEQRHDGDLTGRGFVDHDDGAGLAVDGAAPQSDVVVQARGDGLERADMAGHDTVGGAAAGLTSRETETGRIVEMMKRSAIRLLILAMTLSLLTCGVAAAAETIVVALGSSSTAGKGVASAQTYPAQLEALLNAKGMNVRVINAGINGDTSAGMLSRLDADVPAGTRIVILQAGTNDADEDGHDENLAAIRSRLEARSIRIVLFRTALMRGLRADHAQADGHHLTPDGYRILAGRLLPLVEREMPR